MSNPTPVELSEGRLEPCPFCGTVDPLVIARTCDKHTPYNPEDYAFPRVHCRSCHAEAWGENWTDTKTAIAAWNRRRARPAVETGVDEDVLEQAARAYWRGNWDRCREEVKREVRASVRRVIDVLTSALTPPAAPEPTAVPQGWKLVPVEPTDAMVEAARVDWQGRVRAKMSGQIPIGDHRHALVATYAAMLAAAPSPPVTEDRGGWQPIESAPKDGTPVLLWFVHVNARHSSDPVAEGWAGPHVARWIDHNGGGWTWYGLAGSPTHWRPLPTPPRTLDTQGGGDGR